MTIALQISKPIAPPALSARGASNEDLKKAAREFEATFIAEMLRHTGLSNALSQQAGFGGEAFSSLLIDTYAKQISNNGGFGLAEKIYQQLKDRSQ